MHLLAIPSLAKHGCLQSAAPHTPQAVKEDQASCRQRMGCACLGKGAGAHQEVGAGTADEAQHIVGRLQVVPEADVLMVEHIIPPVHASEHLHAYYSYISDI